MDRIRPAVDASLEYYDPKERPPPMGQKIYLLTRFGTAIVGTWGEWCIGWRPLFRATAGMKQMIEGKA
jgi:hypothetical protein